MSSVSTNHQTVEFRFNSRLVQRPPEPTMCRDMLPVWLSSMPATELDKIGNELPTAKKCPPFLDILQTGFYLLSTDDIKVTQEGFEYEVRPDIPEELSYLRSPLSFHKGVQLSGCITASQETKVLKFHNCFTIKTPPGYSTIFAHPSNDFRLPFRTVSAIVDTDKYSEVPVQIPAIWIDTGFRGLIKKGTPIAQCFLFNRSQLVLSVTDMDTIEEQRQLAQSETISQVEGVYRRQFRSKNR